MAWLPRGCTLFHLISPTENDYLTLARAAEKCVNPVTVKFYDDISWAKPALGQTYPLSSAAVVSVSLMTGAGDVLAV